MFNVFEDKPSLETFVFRHNNDEAILITCIYPDGEVEIIHYQLDNPDPSFLSRNYDDFTIKLITKYDYFIDNQVLWIGGKSIKEDLRNGDFKLPDGKTVGFESPLAWVYGYELGISRFANLKRLAKMQDEDKLVFPDGSDFRVNTAKDVAYQGVLKMLDIRSKVRASTRIAA